MTEQPLDTQGEARDALSSVVADFGPRVLSDPRMLRNRMSDLLPDLPKERQLLVTAAEADVAGELTRHVQEQHLDANTAVQLVAGSLTDRKSIDPASSMWVATEYAKALGYPVQPGAMPPTRPAAPPQPLPPSGQPTVTSYGGHQDPTIGGPGAYGGYGQPQQPPGGARYQPQQPPGGAGYQPQQPPGGAGYQPQQPPGGAGYQPQQPPGGAGYQPQQPPGSGGYQPRPPGGGQAPPAGAPAQGMPGWVSPAPPGKRNRGRVYGIGAGAAAVVIILAVGFGTHWFTGSTSTSSTTHPTTYPPTTVRTTPAVTGPGLAPGVAPVAELLPSDVNPANCVHQSKPKWIVPGLVTEYACYDSGLSDHGDTVFAYQMDSFANYQTSLSAFNTFANFNPNASSGCPPSGGATVGKVPWYDAYFPTATGQIIECGPLENPQDQPVPGELWSFPTEDAYLIAIGSPTTTQAQLNTWWEDNQEPDSSPKPATP